MTCRMFYNVLLKSAAYTNLYWYLFDTFWGFFILFSLGNMVSSVNTMSKQPTIQWGLKEWNARQGMEIQWCFLTLLCHSFIAYRVSMSFGKWVISIFSQRGRKRNLYQGGWGSWGGNQQPFPNPSPTLPPTIHASSKSNLACGWTKGPAMQANSFADCLLCCMY